MEIQDTHYCTSGDTHYFSAISFVDASDMVAAQIGGHDALEDKFRRLELQCLLNAAKKFPGSSAFSVKFERDRREEPRGHDDALDKITVDMTYTRTTDKIPGGKCDKYK